MIDQPPLTDERFTVLESRADAATPGPWGIYESGSMMDIAADLEETGCGYRARREIARFEEEPLDNDPAHKEWTAEEDWAQVRADAVFIAHARTDVPALISEVRRLRNELVDSPDRPSLVGALEIVESWFVDVNDGHGLDASDLIHSLQKAGYRLPGDAPS
ncbi:hypothetical protein RM704_10450 [Streptomyces sp. DSM 3412]|uniref:Uncharacterized protein n=1 Tax=Streptomyces gottesmaniae TaxID=3075518 RepID=A0ABU2YWU8_9ACTN|nr:hypothetical protein [Streptomyces sp. DSM 3412]MDT0567884.1 hypothetical protein [Streptomyces sp. DSM 3412]